MTAADLVTVGIVVVALYLILVTLSAAVLPLGQLAAHAIELLIRPFAAVSHKADLGERRRRIEREIESELGRDGSTVREARADLIAATLQTQRIRILDQKFRTSVGACLQTHWAIAQGLGAVHMSEAARHPMCGQLRERVIDLSELLSDTIESYPLLINSPDLVRLHVGLYRIAPTCIACPYWTTTVSEAPKLCPPAHAVAYEAHRSTSGGMVIDAQIVDGAE